MEIENYPFSILFGLLLGSIIWGTVLIISNQHWQKAAVAHGAAEYKIVDDDLVWAWKDE